MQLDIRLVGTRDLENVFIFIFLGFSAVSWTDSISDISLILIIFPK